jgi:hypothetical protein
MANSLYPAFVRINYHSDYGPHTMTIPTLEYFPDDLQFGTWSGGRVDGDEMVNDLVDLMVPFFTTTVNFDAYTIYTMASPTAPPLPVFFSEIDTPGTSISTEWTKAVQVTFSLRTVAFGRGKLVFLDAVSEGNFDKITGFSFSVPVQDLLAELSNVLRGWSGRDGAMYAGSDQITYTLNETLRRQYNMT